MKTLENQNKALENLTLKRNLNQIRNKLGDSVLEVLMILPENPDSTADSIRRQLKMSQRGVQKNLAKLTDDIAVELTGKDGHRKTRTAKQQDFEFMKPLYMAKFMLDYEILTQFTKVFFQIFDPSQTISTKALTARMIEKFGDTEIVKHSTRAFLKTLSDFNLIEKVTQDSFHQLPKEEISDEQVNISFKLQ